MYEEKLGIPANHQLVSKGSSNEQKKGRDTDIYNYDELDEQGTIIAKYSVKDSMSIYPPQKTIVTYIKYTPDGTEVESGQI